MIKLTAVYEIDDKLIAFTTEINRAFLRNLQKSNNEEKCDQINMELRQFLIAYPHARLVGMNVKSDEKVNTNIKYDARLANLAILFKNN